MTRYDRNMKFFFLLLFVPLAAFAQQTEIRFVTNDPTPLFEIKSLIVEPSGLSLTSDVTEVMKRMELLAVPPVVLSVPNGPHLFNWGGTADFNRSFLVQADGRPLEVRLTGSRLVTEWSLYAMGFGALVSLVTAVPYVTSHGSPLQAIPITSGAISVVGLISFLINSPRVEVRPYSD